MPNLSHNPEIPEGQSVPAPAPSVAPAFAASSQVGQRTPSIAQAPAGLDVFQGPPSNMQRAAWAEVAVATYAKSTGLDMKEEADTAVKDMLASLMHYCDAHGTDLDSHVESKRNKCHPSNLQCAVWAQGSLKAFAQATGLDMKSEARVALKDLLGDTMHFCDARGINFEGELEGAREFHAEEILEDEGRGGVCDGPDPISFDGELDGAREIYYAEIEEQAPCLSPEIIRNTMVDAMARAYYVCAWASAREESGMNFPPQTKIEQVAPSTSDEAREHAEKIAKEIEALNGMSMSDLAKKAQLTDTEDAFQPVTEKMAYDLGWYTAMESLGHGVAWTDDHSEFGMNVPNTEFYPVFGPDELEMV